MDQLDNTDSRVMIIAEAGINHNGDIALAKKMIDVAFEAKADAIKFQTFIAERVISKYAPKAEYQKLTTDPQESQLEMAKKLELNPGEFRILNEYCKEKGITFLSTAFDFESVDLLLELGLNVFKIPSGEITNLPYLQKIGALKKKIIMSTGMTELFEIKGALDVLCGEGTRREDITVLHCNTAYPTPFTDVNLLAMLTIKEACQVKVGYSDHTIGIEVPIAAVALGAKVIEKHFTLDKNMEGPDQKASLGPDELKKMVRLIRNIENALGESVKKPSASELQNLSIARRSLVAARNIKTGEYFSAENIIAKRPGSGISPMHINKIIGRKAKRDFIEDELIEL